MSDRTVPATAGWLYYAPFYVGDLLLLGAAWVIFDQANRPMVGYEVGGFAICVAFGAWLGVLPFIHRHRADLKQLELGELSGTLAQIQNVQQIADKIAAATGQWQTVHEHSVRTVDAAQEIAKRMSNEAKEFFAFFEKANEAEKGHLRLEVEKLRRAEGDWLQVLVRLMDHVFALYSAAVRSGQQNLIEQLAHFQNACRDAARRVGLVPVMAGPETPFDANLHQLPDPDAAADEGAEIVELLAPGYSFQGQLIRRAVVAVKPMHSAARSQSQPEANTSAAPDVAAQPAATEPAPVEAAPTGPSSQEIVSGIAAEQAEGEPASGPALGATDPSAKDLNRRHYQTTVEAAQETASDLAQEHLPL